MDWLLAMTYGAIGGAVVEAVVSSDRVLAWNAARRRALAHTPATPVPALTAYLDPQADAAAGITRILLGAIAGWLFHTQVTGAYAAVAVGCAVPTVLRQLGSARVGSAAGPAIAEPNVEAGPEPAPRREFDPESDSERSSRATPEPEQASNADRRAASAEPVPGLNHPATAEERA